MKPIHYEPHPVSAERKAELVGKGVTIVDAIYAPEGALDAAPKGEPSTEPKLSDGLKVEELKAALTERGIAIPDGVTKKADLAALLDAAPKGE